MVTTFITFFVIKAIELINFNQHLTNTEFYPSCIYCGVIISAAIYLPFFHHP